ncbi:hypothetical protein [Edaphobacter aggregans]|uniref:hypothetical protein n=1 Tax=Edaphobacter aggregans TaxID=570835 RepID=UPI00054FC9FC|nr:hypothetical protein [Edaphobacter aggregans]
MSTAPFSNKYTIKSLEEEISLFERKLAHLHKFESFPSDADRDIAAAKLSAKRDRLIRTVRDLTEGVPSPDAPAKKAKVAAKPKPSTRSKAAAKPAAEPEAPVADVPHQPLHPDAGNPALPRLASPYAGTSLDSEQELKNYLQTRAKNLQA